MTGSIGITAGSCRPVGRCAELAGFSDGERHPTAPCMECRDPLEMSVVTASPRRFRSEAGEPHRVCACGDVAHQVL